MRMSMVALMTSALWLGACADAERNQTPDAAPPADAADPVDGAIDIDALVSPPDSTPPVDLSSTETVCDDGIDDDYDGRKDCRDDDCAGVAGCEYQTEATCSDGLDNDGDGGTDCDDTNCADVPPCSTDCPEGSTLMTVQAGDVPKTIPEIGTALSVATATSTQVVTQAMVGVNIVHSEVGDLELKLSSPDGTNVWLARNRGSYGEGYDDTLFNDGASTPITAGSAPFSGPYQPEQPLAAFQGSPANGDWTLSVINEDDNYTGSLQTYTLYLCTCACEFGAACVDGVDNDGDGATDCTDTDCTAEPRCIPEAGATCQDRADNDLDGAADCDDSDCTATAWCGAETDCADGSDDDTDGATDCGDPGCAGVGSCEFPSEQSCNDIHDNDGDGSADCADPDCSLSCQAGFCPAGTTTLQLSANGLPVSVAAESSGSAPITVVENATVAGIVVGLSATHSAVSYLSFYLTAPSGRSIGLSLGNGSYGDADYTATIFSDAAATSITSGSAPFTGVFRPEQPLESLAGETTAGEWTLDLENSSWSYDASITDFDLRLCVCATGTCEVGVLCADGTDNDGDSAADCADSDCASTALCAVETNCDDGLDDDGDGFGDCADPGCATGLLCGTETSCGDGIDNDADGRSDCRDPGCAGVNACEYRKELSCDDGLDNDGDGAEDCLDSDCSLVPACALGPCPGGLTPIDLTATDLPKSILDNATATSSVATTDTGAVTSITVGVNLTHTYDGDLDLALVAPNGASVALSDSNGGGSENYTGTYFRDTAATPIGSGAAPFTGAFRPEEPLSSLDGVTATGTWQLQVTDNAGGDTGSLTGFALRLCTCAAGTCEIGAQCGDGLDNDSDGGADCEDPNCSTYGACAPEANCDDNTDDDGDGYVDCADPGCRLEAYCGAEADCSDGGDDDADGLPDCADPGCDGQDFCEYGEENTCDDGVDNDGNGSADCDDSTCAAACALTCEAGQTAYGFSATDAVLIPDNNATGATSVIALTQGGTVAQLAVYVGIYHSWVSQLTVSLISPTGLNVALATKRGGSGDNFVGTVFVDTAATAISAGTAPFSGSYQPETALSTVNGQALAGQWRLKAVDDTTLNTGAVVEYKLGTCVTP